MHLLHSNIFRGKDDQICTHCSRGGFGGSCHEDFKVNKEALSRKSPNGCICRLHDCVQAVAQKYCVKSVDNPKSSSITPPGNVKSYLIICCCSSSSKTLCFILMSFVSLLSIPSSRSSNQNLLYTVDTLQLFLIHTSQCCSSTFLGHSQKYETRHLWSSRGNLPFCMMQHQPWPPDMQVGQTHLHPTLQPHADHSILQKSILDLAAFPE